MKTRNILLSLVLLLVLVFSACREVTVTTKVNPDGTFTRIITVTGKDSLEVASPDLPFPVDETWEKNSSMHPSDSTIYIKTYTRTFRNSDELNAEIQKDTSEYKNLEKEVTVSKRFRFFFSYLNFKEVYKCVNPFTKLDYHDYLTEEDIQWNSGLKIPVSEADSVRMNEAEAKFTSFMRESYIAEIESVIREGIIKLNNPGLKPEDISIYHDSLFYYLEWDDLEGTEIIGMYRKFSGNEAFTMLYDLEPPLFEDFEQKLEMLGTIIKLESYTEIVEMPGLITATNSAMLKGNQVLWDFQPLSVMIRDYEMYVESRVVNYWAFILTGIILLALVVLLVVKAVKK